MTVNVGKNPGMIFLSQDQIVSFHNSPVTSSDQDLYFFRTKSDSAPLYSITPTSFLNYRCLHYNMFSPVLVYQNKNHIVLFNDQDVIKPLFQTINVNVFDYQEETVITFWSVLRPGKTTKIKESQAKYDPAILGRQIKDDGTSYVYSYDSTKILKFNQKQIQDYQLQQQYKNAFCSATVQFESLYVSTTNSASSAQQQMVAVIHLPPRVLQQQIDLFPIVDFAIGGSGGGMKQHQHIPYVDGTSYAFSVFHPGTTMPQLSWLSV